MQTAEEKDAVVGEPDWSENGVALEVKEVDAMFATGEFPIKLAHIAELYQKAAAELRYWLHKPSREVVIALRKLLESRDAAIRAASRQ